MRRGLVAFVVAIVLTASARGQGIEKAALDQAKDATVFIKIKAGRMQGSGSGFVMKVTGDTVLVMTNRHVAVPEFGELPEGAKLELSAVFRSGTPQQQELPARVLAYDEREVRDLAVLEVRGVRAPPSPIVADQTTVEAGFFETMAVYALGFPLGGQIQEVVGNSANDPAITVTSMSISSLRRDQGRRLARVQLNGSMIGGNSGGPIVDAKGKLVGVAVSRLRGESVGFAIPPSVIAGFLNGDVGGLEAELLAPQGGNARVRLSVRLVDPLSKLKGVAVRFAKAPSGATAPPPPDPQGNWPLLANGTNVPLIVDKEKGRAGGQFDVPVATPEDRKLFVQFVLTEASGRLVPGQPTSIALPERPGAIAGMVEPGKPKTLAKWSCEVNIRDGVKIQNKVGRTTIEVPGGVARNNAPQDDLFNAPGALVRVNSDFIAVVKVSSDFDPGGETIALPNGKKLPFTFQGAGLVIWQDQKNFIRLERCKGSDGKYALIHRVLVEMYKDGREALVAYTKPLPETPYVLAAIRKGGSIQLLFSISPGTMAVVREMALDFNKDIYVGVSASNLSTHDFTAKFEDFSVKGPEGQEIEAKPDPMTRLDGGPIQRPDGTWFVEGATMKVLKVVGNGSAAPQTNMDKFKGGKWSDNRQLLWKADKMGESLALELPVDADGKFEVKGKFTLSPDYGKVNFALDGKSLLQGKSRDFYDKEVSASKALSLGTIPLTKGKHRFTITVTGKNAGSSGYNCGIDEIQFVPAPAPAESKKK